MIQLFLYEVFGSEVSVEAATYFQKSENRFRILITGGRGCSGLGNEIVLMKSFLYKREFSGNIRNYSLELSGKDNATNSPNVFFPGREG